VPARSRAPLTLARDPQLKSIENKGGSGEDDEPVRHRPEQRTARRRTRRRSGKSTLLALVRGPCPSAVGARPEQRQPFDRKSRPPVLLAARLSALPSPRQNE